MEGNEFKEDETKINEAEKGKKRKRSKVRTWCASHRYGLLLSTQSRARKAKGHRIQ